MLKDGTIKASWLTLKGTIIKGLPAFGSDAPYQVRSIAVKDACDAVHRAKLAYKATGTFNQVKFRSKKSPKQSLYLPKSAVRHGSIFVSILGKTLKSSEPLPEAKYDGRVVYEYGSWWVVLPVDITTEIPKTKEHVVSLDPGIRNFITYYSDKSSGFIASDGWRSSARNLKHPQEENRTLGGQKDVCVEGSEILRTSCTGRRLFGCARHMRQLYFLRSPQESCLRGLQGR